MPVNISGNIIGKTTNAITLNDCSNISVVNTSECIEIKWTDPEDIIFNGDVTARWIGTKLVRKEDAYPKNDKDGVLVLDSKVKNQHSTVAFKDTVSNVDMNYYYCLFPYTEKIVTMSDNNRFTGKRLSLDPILKNNSWEKIAMASEQGLASSLWQIGDEIDLTLSGTFNETVTLQIWDFNHFDKSDGSGKAGICFGMKHLMKNKQQMNMSDTNVNGWNQCIMRSVVMKNILNSMPIELRNVIKEVNTYANRGSGSEENSIGLLSSDKVFLLGHKEAGGTNKNTYTVETESGQLRFPIFTNMSSRIKRLSNGSGAISWWWLRTPHTYKSSGFQVAADNGNIDHGGSSASVKYGVCFMFNV